MAKFTEDHRSRWKKEGGYSYKTFFFFGEKKWVPVTYVFQGYFRGDLHSGETYERDDFLKIKAQQADFPYYIGTYQTRNYWWFANKIWNTSENYDDPLVVKGVILSQEKRKHNSDERARAKATGEKPPRKGRSKRVIEAKAELNPWRVLELPEGSPRDQIKKAYRAQMLLYHPDKTAHLGKEIQVLAERKSKEINWAYELLIGNA